MKMHPEFNLGSIISKISISDIKHSGLVIHAGQPQPNFLTLLDKAQAHQADSPVATAIATLNKSGMDLPNSDDYIAYANPLNGDPRMMFETVKLLNGRSVLTTRISVQPFAASLTPPTSGGNSLTSDISIDATATAAQVLSAEHWSLARSGNTSSEDDPLNQATAESESASLKLTITRAVSDQVTPLTASLVFSSAPAAPLTTTSPVSNSAPISPVTAVTSAANAKPVMPDITPVTNLTPAAPIATSSLVTPEKIATSTEPVLAATSAANAKPVMPDITPASAEPVTNPTSAESVSSSAPGLSAAPAEPVTNLTPAAPIATSSLVTPEKIATSTEPVLAATSAANATSVTPVITAITAPPTAPAVNLVPTAPITSSAMAIPVMPELQSAPGNELIRAALASALDDNNVANTARRAAESMSALQSGVSRSINRVAENNTKPADIDSETGSDEVQWPAMNAKPQPENTTLATERNSQTSPPADTQILRTAAMPPLADTRLLGDAVAQPANASPDQPLVSLIHSSSAVLVPETESTPARFTERWMAYDDLSRNLNSVIHRAVMDRDSDGMVRMRIFLTPENMGTIEAEVVEGNNRMTVNLLVQSEEVAKLLHDSSSALRELLSGSGMNQVAVTIANASEARHARDGQSTDSSGDAAQNTIDEPKSAPPIATRAADGFIDTYV